MISDFLDDQSNDNIPSFNIKDTIDGGRSKTKTKKINKPKKQISKNNSKIEGSFAEYKNILSEFQDINQYIGGQLSHPHINFSDINDDELYNKDDKDNQSNIFSINDAI